MVNEQYAWRYLSGKDLSLAERAFAYIQQRYLPVLDAYLRHAGVVGDHDRDDLISSGFLKLWIGRERTDFPNESAGRSFLYTIITRCMIDSVRAHAKRRTVSNDALIGTRDEPRTDDLTNHRLFARIVLAQLLNAANCLWLKLDPSLLPATHTRQLMAAQMYYLDEWNASEILRILNASPPAGESTVTEAVLQDWLTQPGVLRYLAYEQMLYDATKLLTRILSLRDANANTIPTLWQQALESNPDDPAFGDFSWAAVAVSIMRYQYSISIEEITSARYAALQNWGYSEAQLVAVLEQVCARLPFCSDAASLMRALENRTHKAHADALGCASLWQRLVFQYSYMMDLSHKDILERVQGPARIAGYGLSSSTLNAWTSGKRLQGGLIQYWRELYGQQDDE